MSSIPLKSKPLSAVVSVCNVRPRVGSDANSRTIRRKGAQARQLNMVSSLLGLRGARRLRQGGWGPTDLKDVSFIYMDEEVDW